MEKATFAGGCFWGVEHLFNQMPGVIDAVSGYAGGTKDSPTYEQVCTGRTGHAEAVEVTYDPSKVTYDELLNAFWNMHDPTTLNRQGPDHGHQYRSAIFFHNIEQEAAARKSAALLRQAHRDRDRSRAAFLAGRGLSPAVLRQASRARLVPLDPRLGARGG